MAFVRRSAKLAAPRAVSSLLAAVLFPSLLVGCAEYDEQLPGELVANNVFDLGEISVTDASIYWTTYPAPGLGGGYGALYSAKLASAPFNGDRKALSGASLTPLLLDDGRIFKTKGTTFGYEIQAESSDGTREIMAESDDEVSTLTVDRSGAEPLLIWTSGRAVRWKPFDASTPQEVSLKSIDFFVSVTATPEFIYAASNNGELWRIDRTTAEAERISLAESWAKSFPYHSMIDGNEFSPPDYVSGHLAADDAGVLWMIYKRTFLSDLNPVMIVEFPASGDPPRVVVDLAWNTWRFFLDGSFIYWHEPKSDSEAHAPFNDSPQAVWRAPRDGGPSIFIGEFDARAIGNGFVYFSYNISTIRRAPLPIE